METSINLSELLKRTREIQFRDVPPLYKAQDEWERDVRCVLADLAMVLRALQRQVPGGDVPKEPRPVPMILYCPMCKSRHIDEGEFATKTHHTHACQVCGHVWRPAVTATVGVQFLPGFKNKI